MSMKDSKQSLLVIGRHPEIMQKVLQLLHANGYVAEGVSEDEKALVLLNSTTYQAIVFGGGVEKQSVSKIEEKARVWQPGIKFIYAHPGSLLQDIREQLNT